MDASELTDWKALNALEPYALHPERGIAMLCALVANIMGGKKDGSAFAEDDFVPDLDAPEVETITDPAELKRKAREAMEAAGFAFANPTPPPAGR